MSRAISFDNSRIMSLSHPEISILDFDGTYAQQPELCARYEHRWVDFHALRQTSGYCSDASFHAIQRALPSSETTPITLIGSGNYHYVALARIARLTRPFTLVLFDHHTDSYENTLPGLLSCGSWIRHAVLHLSLLAHTIVIGPPAEATRQVPSELRPHIHFVSDLGNTTPERLWSDIPTDDVYLSIDKDVFSPDLVRTDWDQGDFTLDSVDPFIHTLTGSHHICGVDICGERPASPLEALRPDVHDAIAHNEQANQRLLDALLGAS